MDDIGLFQKLFGSKKNKQMGYYYTTNNLGTWFNGVSTKQDSDTIQSAINIIALHASKIHLKHKQKGNQTSYLEKMLNVYPNEYYCSQQFLYKWISMTFMYDNGWVYPQYDYLTGRYKAFWVLDPNQVSLKQGADNSLWVEFTFNMGEKFTLPYSSLMHLRNYFMKDDILGGVNNTAFNEALTDYTEAKKSIANATKISSRIIATLEVDEMLNDIDREKALESFNKYIENSKNGNSIFVQDLKGKLVPMNLSPKSAAGQQLDSLKSDILEHIPISDAILSGDYTEEQFNSFYETVLETLSLQISQVMTNVLFTQGQRDNGNSIVATTNLIQYASWNTKLSVIDKLMEKRALKIGEARELLGYDWGEFGDEYIQTLNVVSGSNADDYQGVKKGDEGVEDDAENVEE